MNAITRVTIDFDTSHLVFPTLVACLLAVLGTAILIRDRKRIAGSFGYWGAVIEKMDKPRFFGTLALTLIYFSLMVPVGDIWPNTGLGFLICSVPYVFLTGFLMSHQRTAKDLLLIAATSLAGPVFVWWLFTYPLFLTLP